MPTAMRNPFAWTNVSSGKIACFVIWPRVGTKFFNLSHHFLSMDGWPGDAIFFPVGPAFEDHPQEFGQKKVQPLGYYFWHLRLGLFKSLFWLVKLKMCVCSLLQGQLYFQQTNMCFVIWRARWHKILEFVPLMSYLWMIGLVMRLFSCGPTFEDYPQVFSQKKVQPLGYYFWHLRLGPLQATFLVGGSWTCVSVPFCKDNCIFSKKNMCFVIWARVDTKFLNSSHHVLSVDDWPGDATFFLWGQPLKIIRKYSVKKGPAPWILFLTPCALASWSHFFCWWRWVIKCPHWTSPNH